MNVHDFTVQSANGEDTNLADYAGKVLLIVNTASKCGLTPQYDGLELLQKDFSPQGFTVLGFPCNQFAGQEPGTNDEIQTFCSMTFGITFPVMAKIDVNGENSDPLWTFLREDRPGIPGGDIVWNFAKFLIDANGNVVKRYAPNDVPEVIKPDIESLLP